MALPVSINLFDVKMASFMPYKTNIMCIFGYKIFNRKLKIYSMSIRKGNIENIIAQKYHNIRHQKCDFRWSSTFRIYLNYP